jgi:hypothetical protein
MFTSSDTHEVLGDNIKWLFRLACFGALCAVIGVTAGVLFLIEWFVHHIVW